MRKCNYECLIDDYLFHRLTEDKEEKFENHYFNCPYCFKKMEERNVLISVVKMAYDNENLQEKR